MKKLLILKIYILLSSVLILNWSFTGCKNTNNQNTPVETSKDKVFTVGNVSFTMKHIAAANGIIGSEELDDNQPHQVILSDYYIGETEVTQELWEAVRSTNPSYFTDDPAKDEIQGKRPVEQVGWFDCIAFCNDLTIYSGLGESECVYRNKEDNALYSKSHAEAEKEPVMDMSKKGFRLPTEAEWEWAARGGAESRWAGTDKEYLLKKYAWYSGAPSNSKTHQVALKEKNGYGLYDMNGNVWELCWDWYSMETPPGGKKDPTGAGSGDRRVIRGGSWKSVTIDCRTAFRFTMYPDNYEPNDALGLRLVCRDEKNNIAEDTEYNVIFEGGENGKIEAEIGGKKIESPAKALKGETVIFTAIPNDSSAYAVDTWNISGGEKEAGTGEPGSLIAKVKITSDVTVKVSFKKKKTSGIFAAIWNASKSSVWHDGSAEQLPASNQNIKYVGVNSICNKENDIYAAGEQGVYGGDVRAAVWKNNKLIWNYPDEETGTCSDIYADDAYIYLGGSYFKNTENGALITKINIKTLQEERIVLSKDTMDDWGYIVCSIYIDGNNIYAAGKTQRKAVFWKIQDGTVTETKELEAGGKKSFAYSVFVSDGNIYVGGMSNKKPVIWKNGIKEELPCTTSGEVRAVNVSDGKVYAAGQSGGKAALWVDGVIQELSTGKGLANAIAVKNGTVYVSGRDGDKTDSSAVYWKNGEKIEIGKGNAVDILIKD